MIGQIRTGQVWTNQVGTLQVRRGQVRIGPFRTLQVGTAKVGVGQPDNLGQVKFYLGIVLPYQDQDLPPPATNSYIA